MSYRYGFKATKGGYRTWWHNPSTGVGGHETSTRRGDIFKHYVHHPNNARPRGWGYNTKTGKSWRIS